jgi:RHS repeat-associated protein
VWLWNHDPFSNGDPLGATYELRFPGQYFDQATNLHYNYFRDYDPRLGRYIESDPIGLAGGINTYAYADSNPVSGVDPLGLTDGFSQAIGGLYNKLCPPDNSGGQDECTEQWESDTKWCDNNFRGSKNIACHAWASEELARCNKGTPRQPFRY